MKNEIISSAEYKELKFQVTPQMKYRNQKTKIGDITFDSRKEANYYGKLVIIKKNGFVIDFERQVKYPIIVNGEKICTYIADFVVNFKDSGIKVIDVKGMTTNPVYRLKYKLMKAVLGITIKEV